MAGVKIVLEDKDSLKRTLQPIFGSLIITLLMLFSGKQRSEFFLYLNCYILNFWSSNGFELSFGYIALCSVLPAVTFDDDSVRKQFIKDNSGRFTGASIFYLTFSFLLSFLSPGFDLVKEKVLNYETGFVLGFILIISSALLLVATTMYLSIFAYTLKDIFKYKEITKEEYFKEKLKENGLTETQANEIMKAITEIKEETK